MCKELEAVGLQAPEYYSNVFMLQAGISNSNFEKPVINDKKSEIKMKSRRLTIKSRIFKNTNTMNQQLIIYLKYTMK